MMLDIFMRLLIDEYRRYKEDGYKIIEPEEVTKETKKYENDCDVLKQFMDDWILEDSRAKGLKLISAFTAFKQWWARCGSGKKMPTRKELKKAMNDKYGEYTDKWKGISLRDIMDEDD